MAEYIVGLSDGYHSIAFADGLLPATRRPFSITSPSALQLAERETPAQDAALAELRVGALANVNG